MSVPSINLQGSFSTLLGAILPSIGGNPSTPTLAGNPIIHTQLAQQIAAGALPAEIASKASVAIAEGSSSGMGGAQSVLAALAAGKYQNKDGTANGSMDSSLLGMVTGTIGSLDPTASEPTFGTTATTVMSAAVQRVLYTWGTRDANVGKVLSAGVIPIDTIVGKVLQGDFTGALMSSLFGGVFDQLDDKQNMNVGRISTDRNDPRLRVPVINSNGTIVYLSSTLDRQWPRIDAPITTVKGAPGQGNVGHKGHMEAKLGGMAFELPPAVHSMFGMQGAHDMSTPGAEAGISFKHIPNIAAMLIPGSFPAYQSLGIQGHLVDFVGLFVGFDNTRKLNSDLHTEGWYNDMNPDPFYVSHSSKFPGNPRNASVEGGAWAVSRAFQSMVNTGLPQVFELYTGISRIKYQLIITNFIRLYRRDDRVYYRIIGVAMGGGEDLDTSRQQAQLVSTQKPAKAEAMAKAKAVKPKQLSAAATTPTLNTKGAVAPKVTSKKSKAPVAKTLVIAASPAVINQINALITQFTTSVDNYLTIGQAALTQASATQAPVTGAYYASLTKLQDSLGTSYQSISDKLSKLVINTSTRQGTNDSQTRDDMRTTLNAENAKVGSMQLGINVYIGKYGHG